MSDAILTHLGELPYGAEMAAAIRNAASGDPWHTIGHELRLCAGFPGSAFRKLLTAGSFHPEWVLNFAFVYVMSSGGSVDYYAAQLLVDLNLAQQVRHLLTPDNYPDLKWCSAFDSELQQVLSGPNADSDG